MPMTALTGSRVRERRLQLGLRQADLARAAGISASYLNLIEHNRRRIGDEVLARLARALKVEAQTLLAGAEGVLVEDLRAAAASAGDDQPSSTGSRISWAAFRAGRGCWLRSTAGWGCSSGLSTRSTTG